MNKDRKIIAILLICLSLSMVSYINLRLNYISIEDANNSLVEESEVLKAKLKDSIDSNKKLSVNYKDIEKKLESLNLKYEDEKLPNYLTIEILKSKGIEDYKLILGDLKNQRQLIDFEGVLGGTMTYIVEGSYLINEKYVLAYFEDGHIAGYSLLEYTLNDNLEISWKVIDSYIP